MRVLNSQFHRKSIGRAAKNRAGVLMCASAGQSKCVLMAAGRRSEKGGTGLTSSNTDRTERFTFIVTVVLADTPAPSNSHLTKTE